MNINVRTAEPNETDAWNTYVQNHPDANLYHLYGWKNIIEQTYGHKTFYLLAIKSTNSTSPPNTQAPTIVGILPLVHMKHFIFGNNLLSLPFVDMAGILADNQDIEQALLSEAISLGKNLKVDTIELRHTKPVTWLADSLKPDTKSPIPSVAGRQSALMTCATQSHKVRMLFKLPESSEALMKSFKSKFRNKIKKTLKSGLTTKIGTLELLDDFYRVFLVNMRDLGSPVHSKNLIKSVIEEFSDQARLVIVYKEGEPIAGGMMVTFRDTLENPWASALRKYSRLRPNTLLYLTMLSFGCDHKFQYFDFGRSTPDEGTYKFKAQWGAKPEPLHWHIISMNGQPRDEGTTDKSIFNKAIQYWQKLPVPVTRFVGPMIRKHIGL